MTDKLHGKNLRIWIFALLGGIVFAAFDRCGYMIQHYGTLWAISENPLHKTIFHRILIRVPLFTAGVLISFLLLNWLRGRSTDSGAGLPKRESQGGTAPPCLHNILASVFCKLSAGISGRLPGSVCGRCAQSDRLDLLRLADGSSSAAPYGHFMRYFQYDQSFWME